MRRRRQVWFWGVVILLAALLAVWTQSFYGGWAVAVLKNHQCWQVASWRGRLSFTWNHGDTPDPRRWHTRVWQPQPPSPFVGVSDYRDVSDEAKLHKTAYWLMTGAPSALGFGGGTAWEWGGIRWARADHPPWHWTIACWVLCVPYWLLVAVVGAAALPMGLKWRRRALTERRRRRGLCVQCGYDVRASGARCSECGTIVQPAGVSRADVGFVGTVRRLDLQVRRNAGWVVACAMLMGIIFVEGRWRREHVTAVVLTSDPQRLNVPLVKTDGMRRLTVSEALAAVEKRSGMRVVVDWKALGDPPREDGKESRETILHEGLPEPRMPLTLVMRELLRDVAWDKFVEQIYMSVGENPRRLEVTTKDAVLERAGTTVRYELGKVMEPRSGLSSSAIRRERCWRLWHEIDAMLRDQQTFHTAAEGKVDGTTLEVKALPEWQAYIAELLRAIEK